jgi:uncharacterized protein (DUF433 family)
MAVQLKQHIELRGDNPLDAVIDGTNLKAYLVANLAINDGAEASAEHYGLDLATIYAALTFHLDNKDAIAKALEEVREQIRAMGGFDRIDEIRRRYAEKTKKQNDN